MNTRRRFSIRFLFAVFSFLPIAVYSQTPIKINQQIFDSVPLYGASLVYSIQLTKGYFFEVILNLPDEEALVTLAMTDKSGQIITVGTYMNYPAFTGLYLLTQVPASGEYRLEIASESDLDHRIDFSLVTHSHNGDEAEDRSIRVYETLEGVIGPGRESDTFTISLRKGTPVLITLAAPNNILDSVVGIFSPSGEIVAYNDDFFGTASTLFFTPESNGTYWIMVQGKYSNSIGPYNLIVKPVPSYNPPFKVDGEVDEPGDMYVYQVPMKKGLVYDFIAYAVDEFYPLMALADSEQTIYASSQADALFPAATIIGYTPLQDETLYLYVMGDVTSATGFFGVESALHEDEADGVLLKPGDAAQGVIGPIGDMDEYTFFAETGMDYSILVSPTQFYLDPEVHVLDASGKEIFYDDDSVDGLFPLLSGVVLPASAEYRIQVSASQNQKNNMRLTGVYIIQLATGTTFDWGAPLVAENLISVVPNAAGVHITIPTSAVADDTYPLSATLTLDQTGGDVLFKIEKGKPAELDLSASADEVFFLTLSDAAQKHNSAGPVTIPAPRILADLDGSPTALAVDRENNLYMTDSQIGGIVKYNINGASEVILRGEATNGGIYGPNSLAFDADGNLFYSNGYTHSIVKASLDGATETFAANLNFPVYITFDKKGVMYVAQIGSDTVDKVYQDGRVEPFVTSIRNPYCLAFSPDGVLYVCNSAEGESGVYRILEDGAPMIFLEPFSNSLRGMAFDRDGYLYVAEEDSGYLYRVSPDGDRIQFTRDLGATAGLAFGYGDSAKTLFACSGLYYKNPYRIPYYYEQRLIAVPTGRRGVPVPDSETSVADWMMF